MTAGDLRHVIASQTGDTDKELLDEWIKHSIQSSEVSSGMITKTANALMSPNIDSIRLLKTTNRNDVYVYLYIYIYTSREQGSEKPGVNSLLMGSPRTRVNVRSKQGLGVC